MGFFSELHDDLVRVKKKIAQADESMLSEQEREQYELITAVASSMIDNPELWEEQCLFNIHYIGENFKSLIQNFLFDFSDKNLSYLYDDVVRFLAELNLSFQQKEYSFNPGSSLFPIIKRLKEQMFYSGEKHPDSLNYAFYKMPIDILCFYMGNQGFKTFFEFDERKNALETSITKYWDEIQQKIDEVNVLKDKLDEYKTAFNFVGLSKGFENLLKQKNEAKKENFGAVGFVGNNRSFDFGYQFLCTNYRCSFFMAIHATHYRLGICLNLFLQSGFNSLPFDTDSNHAVGTATVVVSIYPKLCRVREKNQK